MTGLPPGAGNRRVENESDRTNVKQLIPHIRSQIHSGYITNPNAKVHRQQCIRISLLYHAWEEFLTTSYENTDWKIGFLNNQLWKNRLEKLKNSVPQKSLLRKWKIKHERVKRYLGWLKTSGVFQVRSEIFPHMWRARRDWREKQATPTCRYQINKQANFLRRFVSGSPTGVNAHIHSPES